jgi:hypothetical protein
MHAMLQQQTDRKGVANAYRTQHQQHKKTTAGITACKTGLHYTHTESRQQQHTNAAHIKHSKHTAEQHSRVYLLLQPQEEEGFLSFLLLCVQRNQQQPVVVSCVLCVSKQQFQMPQMYKLLIDT